MNASLRLIDVVNRAGQLAAAIFERIVKTERPITARQAQVLAAIKGINGGSQTDVAQATGIDRSTLSQICQILAKKRLITRRRSKVDTRAYVLTVTDNGLDTLREIDAASPEVAREICKKVQGIEQLHVVGAPVREAAE